ncbi:MAG TPA: MmcQ/YjbR family DNA-binding protein, partial [Streptosporangiaceae bacterium]|nr:MmcQ/YjbR family DNA-binding protein [Streptosporangiaceae bacterium]
QTPPEGPILAVRVEDLGEKEAALAAHPEAFFTIPHFDGYSAVLIQLRLVSLTALREAITDGWLACAPPALAAQHLRQ